MHPYLMVAAPILFTKTRGVVQKAPCKRTCRFSWESGGLRKPQTSDQSPSTAPGHHNGGTPSDTSKFVPATGFLKNTGEFLIVAAWAAPSDTVEVPNNQIHMLHHSKDCKCIFHLPRFWANWLLVCNDIVMKDDFTFRGNRQNDAREMTPCRTHPDRLWYQGGTLMSP